MIKQLIVLFAAAFTPAFMSAQDAPAPATESYPHYVLNNTELRPLHSKETGRDYLLYVAYPYSYQSHPERKYPVVYLTDAYWAFDKMNAIGGSLWYDQIVPEYILVGIGYAGENVDYGTERVFELTPNAQDYGFMKNFKGRQGGARQFLTAIKTEIIPYVENNLRADPSFRVLVGSSLGGLFSLYAMYEEPELFQGVIAGSPAVSWNHCWLFQRESELREKALGDDYSGRLRMPTRLFMGVGGAEWPGFVGYIQAFDNIIKSGDYQDFSYQFRMIEGERHGGNTAELYNRGLRFVFEPRMPSATIPNN